MLAFIRNITSVTNSLQDRATAGIAFDKLITHPLFKHPANYYENQLAHVTAMSQNAADQDRYMCIYVLYLAGVWIWRRSTEQRRSVVAYNILE